MKKLLVRAGRRLGSLAVASLVIVLSEGPTAVERAAATPSREDLARAVQPQTAAPPAPQKDSAGTKAVAAAPTQSARPAWRAPGLSFAGRLAANFLRLGEEQLALLSAPPAPDADEASEAPGVVAPVEDHTAVYDIAAHAVYLPNGDRLEAHSGLGHRLDDPRYVGEKNRGPTPPNVYNLVPRGQLFHGVRALRLVPADAGKMFGRDGILAHSYMHGANGQSNGCVVFRDYPAFLNAFRRGDVERLVVVESLEDAPDPVAAAAPVSAPNHLKRRQRRASRSPGHGYPS